MTQVSRGKITKRTWRWQGRKRIAYALDVVVNGERTRRQYPSRAEAQEELDKFREEARVKRTDRPVLSFSDAITRYLASKARRKSLPEVTRILESFKAAFGADTPLHEITAPRSASRRPPGWHRSRARRAPYCPPRPSTARWRPYAGF